jgi:NifU-like protein involved in Fe-S cluster formation
MVQIFVKFHRGGGIVMRATFRTFGCSACIAASSIATELLIGRDIAPTGAELDAALGGLPDEKRYCADLVAEAAQRALTGTAA